MSTASESRRGRGKKKAMRKVDEALMQVQRLLEHLPEDELEEFRDGMAEILGFDHDDDEDGHHGHLEDSELLNGVVADLRAALPVSAEAPNEAPAADSKQHPNSAHVDAFLFDDTAVDDLIDSGKLSPAFCCKCGSRDTKPLTFVSHSASRRQLGFLYSQAQEKGGRDISVICDVGSRLGAALFVAHEATEAKEIVGIEMNTWFCELQKKLIAKYEEKGLLQPNRIKIIEADVRTEAETLGKSDLVILNNVWEWFTEDESGVWKFIREKALNPALCSGVLLATMPGLQETEDRLGESARHFMRLGDWVSEIALDYPEDLPEDDELRLVHLYRIR